MWTSKIQIVSTQRTTKIYSCICAACCLCVNTTFTQGDFYTILTCKLCACFHYWYIMFTYKLVFPNSAPPPPPPPRASKWGLKLRNHHPRTQSFGSESPYCGHTVTWYYPMGDIAYTFKRGHALNSIFMVFSSYCIPLGTVDALGWKCVLGWRCEILTLGSFDSAYRLTPCMEFTCCGQFHTSSNWSGFWK